MPRERPKDTTLLLGGAAVFSDGEPVVVWGADVEALLVGAPVALGLERRGQLGGVQLGHAPTGESDTLYWMELQKWWRSRRVQVGLAQGPQERAVVIVGGADLLLKGPPEDAPAANLVAVVGLGAEAADGQDVTVARRKLAELASHGALVASEMVARFGQAGRGFVELIEEVHHAVGPERQSVRADALRAALFGRFGNVPVNLASRETPPALDLSTTTVFFVRAEALRAS